MARINLRTLYPHYHQDCFIEVTDELAQTIMSFERKEEAYQRKVRRHKAYYSLEQSRGIESCFLFKVLSPEELYERKVTRDELRAAIAGLPDKQAKRIYAHLLLGMNVAQIAKAEGIGWSSANRSIQHGLMRLRKIFSELI